MRRLPNRLTPALALLALLALAGPSPAEAGALASETCLGCHADAETVTPQRVVDPRLFDHTAHAELGCPTCHASVGAGHPEDGLTPSRASCRDCHQAIAAEYAATDHAANAACGDCHNPHAAHATREVSGQDMNRPCAACHAAPAMAAAHGAWLPQAQLHLEMLPCVTCHTASRDYVITLYLSRPRSAADPGARTGLFAPVDYAELKALSGGREPAALVDADGDGFVSLAELKRFNPARASSLRLTGMLTPEVVTHNLQILDNRWDCTFCHASGPGAMQTSYFAVPRADGSYGRLPVEKGAILDALNGTPDFYMMGATRNASLNLLGLAILAGGLVMPVGHGFLRFLTRNNRP